MRERELWILRHGKSDWADAGMADVDRPLAPRGIRASERMGRHLASLARPIDEIRCSSATRTRETLERLEQGYGSALDATLDDDLYLASAGQLLDQVHALADASRTALLIGHNPGLEDLAAFLVGSGSAEAVKRLAQGLKTATFVRIALPDAWPHAGPGTGRLVECTRPRDLPD